MKQEAPTNTTRRLFLTMASALAGGVAMAGGTGKAASSAPDTSTRFAPEALKNGTGTKLVLLGTCGGPTLGQRRHQTSHILLSNNAAYVVDCGMTVANRIAQAGVDFGTLRGIFITHHHPDHNAEYGPLMLMAWLHGLRDKLDTYGPPPLGTITSDYLSSIKWTVDLWIKDVKFPPFPPIVPHELAWPGHVMEDENVRVTSVLVKHPPIVPAYGYRFDFKDRSIAFSGDTVPVESVVKLARGADVLVHEAMYVPALTDMLRLGPGDKDRSPERFAQLMDHMHRDHSPVEAVGRIAQEAGVKTLVLSHLTPGGDRPVVTDEQWKAAAAKHFRGEIIVGHDLMVI